MIILGAEPQTPVPQFFMNAARFIFSQIADFLPKRKFERIMECRVRNNIETTLKGTRIIRLVQQKTKTEVTIPILNDNLIALFEKYNYNVPKANEQVLNRYIKKILRDLSETMPSLKVTVPTKLTMKQKEAMRRDKIERTQDPKDFHGLHQAIL